MKPSQEFTFKILSDEDFDNLPYDDAKSSLGLSVMSTKTAYIRKTGVKELDMGTIQHEFDELMQQTSPHEINGIRYKKGGGLGKLIITTLATLVNPFLGAAVGVGAGAHSLNQQEQARKKAQEQQAAADRQFQDVFGGFGPSQATQAFAPQVAQTPKPLGLEEFNKSLGRLSSNEAATRQNVFSQFRGISPKGAEGNTAFSTSLKNAQTSSDLARKQFLEDQRKLGSTFA
jgi:hypothetical protein